MDANSHESSNGLRDSLSPCKSNGSVTEIFKSAASLIFELLLDFHQSLKLNGS